MVRLREMIYGDERLQQVPPTELLAVSRRDKRERGCFPDRQGDSRASACVNKNAAIFPRPATGLTPLSISRAHRSRGPSPLLLLLVKVREKGESHLLPGGVRRARAAKREEMLRHMLPQFY